MPIRPKHMPYDGSHKPFEIGLHPLDIADWIEVDEERAVYLREKRRLLDETPDKVFVEEPDTQNTQEEVLKLLVEHLVEKFPEVYTQTGNTLAITGTDYAIELEDTSSPALLRAALLVQEDLVVMRKSEMGWRLVTASVSFPSSWNLQQKFSRPMHEIHQPVPGFGEGTRKAQMIERIFDNLQVDLPAERFNWSIYSDNELFHDDRTGEHFHHSKPDVVAQSWLRVERQTLRKLPKSGDILFTIRIHLDPMKLLAKRTNTNEIIDAFIASLNSLDRDQAAYKVLEADRSQLIKRLEELRD